MTDPAPAPAPAATPSTAPKRSPWPMAFFGIVLTIVVIEGGACIVGSRQLASMTAGTGAKIAEANARKSERPALRGTTTPGSAWEHYRKPDSAFPKDTLDDIYTLERWLHGDEKTTKAAADAVVAKYEGQLVHLRAGAACGNAQFPFLLEKGSAFDCPRIHTTRWLSALAAAKARELTAAGKGREAAELLLDLMQHGVDFCRNAVLISNMMGVATIGDAARELALVLKSDRLTKEELASVAQQLERLDAGMPSTEIALRNEAVILRVTLLEQEVSLTGGSGYPGLVHPRYFFMPSLMRTDAVNRCESMLARMADAAGKTWAEVVASGERHLKEANESPNPLVRITMPGLQAAERSHRERHAQIRLLRMAVVAKAGGPVPELDDPFGAKLRQSKDGTKRKFWSVSRDGVDNGGTGTWNASDKDSADIVLEYEEK